MFKMRLLILPLCIAILSGCLYPNENVQRNQAPYESQLRIVQESVEMFQEDNGGLLPIKTKDSETNEYMKYQVDFKQLVPKYMAEYPSNSYEEGGIFVYTLINVDSEPLVRMLDARAVNSIQELQLRLQTYLMDNEYPPYKEVIENGIYSLDYEKLNMKTEATVVSPFTTNNLPLLIDSDLQIVIDYRSDVYDFIQKQSYESKPNEDLLHVLSENSMFVPVNGKSIYINEAGDPTYLQQNK